MLLTLNHISDSYISYKLRIKASCTGSKKCNPERIVSIRLLFHITVDLLF